MPSAHQEQAARSGGAVLHPRREMRARIGGQVQHRHRVESTVVAGRDDVRWVARSDDTRGDALGHLADPMDGRGA